MKLAKLICLSVATSLLVLNGVALADTDEQRKFSSMETDARFQIGIWKTAIENAFGAESNRTHAELLNSMKTASDKLLAYLKGKPCKDNAQAQALETYLHGRFHELYGKVVADIKHGVNLSCSRDHTLVPTLWVTDYTSKAAAAKESAAKRAQNPAEAAQHARVEVTRIAKEWVSKVSKIYPYKGPPSGETAAKAILRPASTTAAQAFGSISCAGDDKLADFAMQALADGAQVPLPLMKNTFPIKCAGGKLQGSMTL